MRGMGIPARGPAGADDPLTALGASKDIGLAAMLVLLDMFVWLAALNALFTGIGWLLERPESQP